METPQFDKISYHLNVSNQFIKNRERQLENPLFREYVKCGQLKFEEDGQTATLQGFKKQLEKEKKLRVKGEDNLEKLRKKFPIRFTFQIVFYLAALTLNALYIIINLINKEGAVLTYWY
jgi:hypothetical protein